MRITAVILLSLLFVASLNAQGACAGPGSNNVVRISSLAEYNAVKDCVTMNGLQITTANLPFALTFPQLTTLNNAISVSNATGLTSIEMPLLATTTGQISITGCPDITKIIIGADSATGITQGTSANMVFTELPAITDIRVGVKTAQRVSITAVGVAENTGALSFPALTTVTPQAVSVSSSKFGSISFASLTSTGSVTLNNNDVGVVNFPKNLTTTGFTVTNNRGMTSVTINPIQIGTATQNVDFQFSDNKGGSYGLRLDSLTAVNGKFLVNGNDGLTSLVIPKSFGTQQVSISGNGLNSADIAYCVVAADADVSNNAPTTGAPGAVNLGFGKVGGSLFVAQNTFGALTFGALQAVGGLVRLDTNSADSISFPSTFLASGNITLLQNTLTSATTGNLDVSGIQGTNGSLLIQNNKNDNRVSALVFRDLQFVAGQFLIDTNNFVNSISVPSLKIVGALSGGSQYKGDESTSFIVQNNEKLLTFNGTGSGLFIIVGNLTISNNDAITTINADSLGQAGALSIQRDAALTSFSANGLVCAAIVEFNSVNALRTVSLTSVSRIEQSLVIAQGGEGDQGACAASINSTSGAACTGGTPACYNCQGNQGGASNCGSPIAALANLCGSDKSFCPVARALALIDTGAGPTVDGAGTFGQGSGTSRASSATTPGNGNTSPGNTVSTQQNSAVSNIAAIFLVAVALFAGF